MEKQLTSAERIETLVRANCPFIWVVSHEEARVLRCLGEVAKAWKRDFGKWSINEGMSVVTASGVATKTGGEAKDSPAAALGTVVGYGAGEERGSLFALLDFHPYMGDPQVVRGIRDAATAIADSKKAVVFVGPVLKLPPELEKEVAVVDFDLPTLPEIRAHVKEAAEQVRAGTKDERVAASVGDPAALDRVAEACLGLTEREVENVLAQSIIRTRDLSVPICLEEKRNIIRKSGVLDFYEPREGLDDVGGAGGVKRWLRQRRSAFSQAARDFGLPEPKGMLLLGCPGTGKSLIAKATGSFLQMPLLRLDAGRLFAGLVGASEGNAREAIRVAESIAPAVLWIDELDKAFAGMGGESTDGGTTQRVFGTILTWMQEKRSAVFVVASANDVARLPAELLRRGRFDEIFFVDLPTPAERAEILGLHLARRGHLRDGLGVPAVVEATDGFSGAELEQVVVDALYAAFEREGAARRLEAADLAAAAARVTPLSRTMRERIDEMRTWAKGRAAPAREDSPARDNHGAGRFAAL